MSILGALVRVRPDHLDDVAASLAARAGVDVAVNPGDGRLVLVLEDVPEAAAAATLAAIAMEPHVLNTSLVYEYSGPDAPAPDGGMQYTDWRQSPRELAAQAARASGNAA